MQHAALSFPDVNLADEDGLLAIGGDLSPERLILAYQSGIFPWYNSNEPILWWSPDPRFVLLPEKLHISKSMRKIMNGNLFHVTFNTAFDQVIENCQQINRNGQDGTWISEEMLQAYKSLHRKGVAKSVEVWQDYQRKPELVGGLYGIDLGNVFCGESMFAKVSNASKYGFIKWVQYLQEKKCELIDCQVYTEHLNSLGAEMIAREDFLAVLKKSTLLH